MSPQPQPHVMPKFRDVPEFTDLAMVAMNSEGDVTHIRVRASELYQWSSHIEGNKIMDRLGM